MSKKFYKAGSVIWSVNRYLSKDEQKKLLSIELPQDVILLVNYAAGGSLITPRYSRCEFPEKLLRKLNKTIPAIKPKAVDG